MTAREPARQPAQKRTKTTPDSAKMAAEQGKQPADSGAKPARTPAKRARKPRQPAAGAKLRRELSQPKDDYSVELLITQAARVADRLEVLGRLLDGDPNAWMAVRIDGQVVEVRVDGALVEERQLSEVLRKLIMDIQRIRAADDNGGTGDGGSQQIDPLVAVVKQHYVQAAADAWNTRDRALSAPTK